MTTSEQEESVLMKALRVPSDVALGAVLKAALELDLFQHIAGAQLSSASQIAALLPTHNPEAPDMVDRILRLLASRSYLDCTLVDGKRFYSLAPAGKAFIRDENGVSIAPMLLVMLDRVLLNAWYIVKDAVLEGGMAFNKAHGMNTFEYMSVDSRFNEVFNRGMSSHSGFIMKQAIEVYNGFEGLREIVDVGGGLGTCLSTIISKYPTIKGINFDQPVVIKHAPAYPGVEHVAGDMFEHVPKGEAIFMKWILHDWSDDDCVKLLKNCWEALPESGGKVMVVEAVLPEQPKSDVVSMFGFTLDFGMMAGSPGGKERTLKEFEAVAIAAGFSSLKLVCPVYHQWVLEFYKN